MRSYSEDEDEDDEIQEPEEVDDEEPDEADDEPDEEAIEAQQPRGQFEFRSVEEWIRHLEDQNQDHQDMEDQYRSLVYQTLGENAELTERVTERDQRIAQQDQRIAELEAQIQQHESSVDQNGSLIHQVVARNTELRESQEQTELRLAELKVEHEAMRAEFDLEIADKIRVEDAWTRSARRVTELEREVRDRAAQFDSLSFAMTTAFGRLRDRVRRYPREEGRSRRTVRRRVVDRIARQEYDDAVRRAMH